MNRPKPSNSLWRHLPLLTALPWLAFAAQAAVELRIGEVTGSPGRTVRVPVQFTADTPVVGLQIEFVFPTAKLASQAVIGGDALADHQVPSNEVAPGVRRILVFSPTNAALRNGVLIEIPVTVASNAPLGALSLTLTNVVAGNGGAAVVQPLALVGGSLTVLAALEPPTIVTQPLDQPTVAGGTATFLVVASGSASLSYQWQRNGQDLVGATNATLVLVKVQPTQAGPYRCVVTNAQGSAVSDEAWLQVSPPEVNVGQRWRYVTIPGLPSGATLGQIWARSRTEAYVWCQQPNAASPDVSDSLLYRWDGSRWSLAAQFPGASPGRISGTGSAEVWASVYRCTTGVAAGCGPDRGGRLYRSTDHGTNWTEQPITAWVQTDSIGTLSGTQDNLHVVIGGGRILRFNGAGWALVLADPTNGVAAHTVLRADEGFYVTGWGWGYWDGTAWAFHGRQFGFTDVRDLWAMRDAGDHLAFYAVGNNDGENGVRVWQFDPTTLSFGDALAPAMADNDRDGTGGATGIAGSGPADIYVIGELASQPGGPREGRLYHYDGSSWSRLTGFGPWPTPGGIACTAPDDVWVSLADGRLLHLGSVTNAVAPVITGAPLDLQVLLGADAVFSVLAEGTTPLSFQWYRNGTSPIAGATNSVLIVTNVQVTDAGTYHVVASNSVGVAVSPDARLSVMGPPVVAVQPQSRQVTPPADVTLSVSVSGQGPFAYQWRKNGANIVGATNATLVVQVRGVEDGGSYSVVVANAAGTVTSEAAVITVVPPAPVGDRFADRLTLTMGVGQSVQVAGSNMGATSEPGEPAHAGKPGGKSVWYRWVAPADGVAGWSTAGSSFDTLLGVYTGGSVSALTPVAASDDGGQYFASELRFNAAGGTEYAIAVDGFAGQAGDFVLLGQFEATAQQLPVIVQQPQSWTVPYGGGVTLSVVAQGQGLSYQWSFNGQPLVGQTGSSLGLGQVREGNVGYYQVRVSNGQGRWVDSAVAIVEVGPEPTVQSRDKWQYVVGGGAVQSQRPLGLRAESLAGLGAAGRGGSGGFLGSPGVGLAGATAEPGFISVSVGVPVMQILNNVTNATTQAGEPHHGDVIGSASLWLNLQSASDGIMLLDTSGSVRVVKLEAYRWTELLEVSDQTLVGADVAGAPDGSYSVLRFGTTNGARYLVMVDTPQTNRGSIRVNCQVGWPPWGSGALPGPKPGPETERVPAGGAVHLVAPDVVTAGEEPVYEWYRDGRLLAGAVGRELSLSELGPEQAGLYSVRVRNAFGEVTYPVKRVAVAVPLRVVGMKWMGESGFALQIQGDYGQGYTVEACEGLTGDGRTGWTDLAHGTNGLLGVGATEVDSAARQLDRRFYRLRAK